MSQATIQSKFAWGFEFLECDGSDKICHNAAGLSKYWYCDDTPKTTYHSRVFNSTLGKWVSRVISNGNSGSEGEFLVSLYQDTEANAFTAAGLNNPPGFAVETLTYYTTDGNSLGDSVFWGINGTTADNCLYVNRYADAIGSFRVKDSGNTQRTLNEATGMPFNSWVHWICSVQKGNSNPWYIYRNGSSTAGGATSWTYGDLKAFTTWSYIFLGSRNTGLNYPAYMSFCRLYKDYLTTTEMVELYNSGAYRGPEYVNANYRQQDIQTRIDIGSGTATGSLIDINT